ncbi:MAG TPA: hypothetical protein VNK89_11190 [Thermoflexus sp.]|nr:hypothetical protein [Thermoflexus sp.]
MGLFWMVGIVLLAVSCARPGSETPSPTASVTVIAPRPTAPPADDSPSACPKDPSQWRLVEISTVRDPYGVPLYRIDPPCVYEGFWRDVALHEFLAPDRPTVSKEKWVDIPWYWELTTPVPKKPFRPYAPGVDNGGSTLYDQNWQRIDLIFTPYTVLRTEDPDFPMVIYLYEDFPGAAYFVRRDQGKIDYAQRVLLEGGTVLRHISLLFYDAHAGHWFFGSYRPKTQKPTVYYPCGWSVETMDGSKLWEALGVKGSRHSELAQAFSLQEIFPDRLDPKALELQQDARSISPCEKGR